MTSIARRSQLGAAGPDTRRSHAREESWEHVEDANGVDESESPLRLTFGNPREALHPLRAIADRVGQQVEQFAEKVDHWKDRGMNDAVKNYLSTVELVKSFKTIADDTVKHLNKQHGSELEQERKRATQRRLKTSDDRGTTPAAIQSIESDDLGFGVQAGTTLQDLQHWQSEADTWELLRLLVEEEVGDPRVDRQQEKEDEVNRRGPVHRYTPEIEVWERFLVEDDQARGRKLILNWLEATARHNEADANSVMERLQDTGRGQGTWSQGWLDTRERIKITKKMSANPRQHAASVRATDRTRELVTELDPDAVTRQYLSLEKVDDQYEQTIWLAIWVMLRQGKTWEEVREWCRERNEGWRAVSMGMAHATEGARTCLEGAYAGQLWRRLCFVAARQGGMNEYERAVYGMLSGDQQTVDPVCRTWEDYLYVRFHALLLSQYDAYAEAVHPDRLPASLTGQYPLFDALQYHGNAAQASRQLVESVNKLGAVAVEGKKPMKMIQGSLIGKYFEDLLYKYGVAISKRANSEGVKSTLVPKTEVEAEEAYMTMTEDYNALRIVVHAYLLLNALDLEIPSEHRPDIENVLAGYIDFLRLAGKIDLIPTYAAQLSPMRAEYTLARVLPDIRDVGEQRELMDLMRQAKISVGDVLIEHYEYVLTESSLGEHNTPTIKRYEFLEPTAKEQSIWPGQRIKLGFLPNPQNISADEDKLVRAGEWYMLLPNAWNAVFIPLTIILKRFLRSGRVGAAVALCQRMPFKTVSREKSRDFLHIASGIDVMEEYQEEEDYEELPPQLRRSTRSATRAAPVQRQRRMSPSVRSLRVEQMREQSRVYYELQQLVNMLIALDKWRKAEKELVDDNNPRKPADSKATLRKLFDNVRAAIEPLFSDFLTHGIDDAELTELTAIRHAYIPEILFAYLSVIHSAAQLLTREHLLLSMQLATVVADEANSELAEAFVETGRMGKLVGVFAENSKMMLKLAERKGKVKGRGKKRNGETLEIWEVRARN
ncbi:Nucleoporin nup84 [Coniosporium apollinis]|uniref:Nuclear pore complex protein n=1 Tax=Coniosporium apollinis TaxID=61459 RepID=A0ABQ9P648_9PEZI|nr:Nucleoporin nup84 [Coniosporium apollinis]